MYKSWFLNLIKLSYIDKFYKKKCWFTVLKLEKKFSHLDKFLRQRPLYDSIVNDDMDKLILILMSLTIIETDVFVAYSNSDIVAVRNRLVKSIRID
jgi:hypothetical protein